MITAGQYVTFSIVRETGVRIYQYTPVALAQLVAQRKNWSEDQEQILREGLVEVFKILEVDGEHHGKRG